MYKYQVISFTTRIQAYFQLILNFGCKIVTEVRRGFKIIDLI